MITSPYADFILELGKFWLKGRQKGEAPEAPGRGR